MAATRRRGWGGRQWRWWCDAVVVERGGGEGGLGRLTGCAKALGVSRLSSASNAEGHERRSGNASRGLLVMSGMGSNTVRREATPREDVEKPHHSLLLRLPPIHRRLPTVAPAPPALTIFTCCELRSASLKTATVLMPSFFAVRITRHAISPLFATSTLSSSGASLDAMRARGRIRELRAKSDMRISLGTRRFATLLS